MSRIAVLVEVTPDLGQLSKTCFEYCKTALDLGHSLKIFMYGRGVPNICSEQNSSSNDDLVQWEKISENPLCQVVVCFAGATKRRLVGEKLQQIGEGEATDEWFQTGGLGEWTENMFLADLVIQFR